MNGTTVLNIEEASHDSFSVHWSAVFSGVFVAVLSYIILMSLGLAVGAGELKDVISGDDSLRAVGAGTGIWMIVSVIISLFLGSYAAGRVSGIIASRVGYVQGSVITALFFLMMISQIGAGLGMLGAGLTNLTSGALKGAGQMSGSTRLNAVVEDVVSDMDLISPPSTVVTGVVSRLVRGDTESAKNYLAAQSGMSRTEAQARIDSFNEKFKVTMTDVGERSAQAASVVGWTAFITILLGTIASIAGGGAGALMNMRKPLSKTDVRFLRSTASAYSA